jgi:hypothetical protein
VSLTEPLGKSPHKSRLNKNRKNAAQNRHDQTRLNRWWKKSNFVKFSGKILHPIEQIDQNQSSGNRAKLNFQEMLEKIFLLKQANVAKSPFTKSSNTPRCQEIEQMYQNKTSSKWSKKKAFMKRCKCIKTKP